MATENKERDKKREEYEEGLKKTLTPSLFGVLAGVISFFVVPNPASEDGLLIAILMILVQKFVYPFMHTSIKGAKDWIYISAITSLCWFIAFSLLLNLH
ncbi:MAG: hypothetical protein EFT35_05665 [Methanophagales archaeon ANME-1-THS]|nr:MAG: hypothetical protein EFT35_05665 [Methanophagales archaeon ANME-1-THS]